MDYAVPKTRNHSPRDFRMLCDEIFRHLPSGFAEHFKVADYCVYCHLGL